MKKPVTYLGDAFYYALMSLSALTFIWLLISPAKYVVCKEIIRLFQNKGEEAAIKSYDELLSEKGIARDDFRPNIIIRKKNRELAVYSNYKLIKSYHVGLGRVPIGKKQRKDDFKTPEGEYYICKKDIDHKYHLFLQINYPSPKDAEIATVKHIISTGDEIHINQAEINGDPPPADTDLGGNLGIHGYGTDDWTTDGSISMHNNDMEELYWNIKAEDNIEVLILP